MIYLTKTSLNTLTLNITNNSRTTFTGYTFVFKHIMSQESKTYTIDTSDTNVFTSNERYCEVKIDLSADDLNYFGQYELNIYGNGDTLVYTGITNVKDGWEEFIEYDSDNENNSNYIYVN